MSLFYSMVKLTVGNGLRLGGRPIVAGVEHVPRSGGAILASNHLSVADEMFLGAVVPRHIAFWAKAEYWTGSGIRGWLTKSIVDGMGAIRVERAGGRAALTAFDGAVPVLKSGDIVAIYPEGTRSPDGRLYRGRTGVARLALAAGVPIVPVGIIGTDRVQPIGARFPKPFAGRPVIRFGKPIEVGGRPADRHGLRQLTDEVMTEIQKLTGQQHVGRYAPKRAE